MNFDPSNGSVSNVFGVAEVEPPRAGDQIEESSGYLDQLQKSVVVTLPKLKMSSDRKSKDFDPVSISARKVMLSNKISTEIKDAKEGTVVKKLKSLAASVWRFLSGKRWKKIPDAKRQEILKPLSEDGRAEMENKMDKYDEAIASRNSLKAEWKSLARQNLEYKHDFGIALTMVKVANGGKGIMPSEVGLIFALPASNDGKSKEYVQLGRNSEMQNLQDAKKIAEALQKHPSFQEYLDRQNRMREIEGMRDSLLEELEGLEAAIPGLVKKDAEERGAKRKADTTDYLKQLNQKKFKGIEDFRDSQTKGMNEDIEYAENKLPELVSRADELKTEVDDLKLGLNTAKDKLKSVQSDIAIMEQTKNKRLQTDAAISGVSLDRLVESKTSLENQIKSDERSLGSKSKELAELRTSIAQEQKALADKKAERDAVVKQAEAQKVAVEQGAAKEFKRHSREIDDEGKAEFSNARKAVTGRPGKEKAPKPTVEGSENSSSATFDVNKDPEYIEMKEMSSTTDNGQEDDSWDTDSWSEESNA